MNDLTGQDGEPERDRTTFLMLQTFSEQAEVFTVDGWIFTRL
jgi:hypothetical protein